MPQETLNPLRILTRPKETFEKAIAKWQDDMIVWFAILWRACYGVKPRAGKSLSGWKSGGGFCIFLKDLPQNDRTLSFPLKDMAIPL